MATRIEKRVELLKPLVQGVLRPSGEQFDVALGGQKAVVVEADDGLRELGGPIANVSGITCRRIVR
jgi:hypothetical protein